MNYNVKELLVLPPEEKIILADLLYSSVNDELKENNNSAEWWKDGQFVDKLNKEYEEWKTGKAKGYTTDEVREFMKEQRRINDL